VVKDLQYSSLPINQQREKISHNCKLQNLNEINVCLDRIAGYSKPFSVLANLNDTSASLWLCTCLSHQTSSYLIYNMLLYKAQAK